MLKNLECQLRHYLQCPQHLYCQLHQLVLPYQCHSVSSVSVSILFNTIPLSTDHAAPGTLAALQKEIFKVIWLTISPHVNECDHF